MEPHHTCFNKKTEHFVAQMKLAVVECCLNAIVIADCLDTFKLGYVLETNYFFSGIFPKKTGFIAEKRSYRV